MKRGSVLSGIRHNTGGKFDRCEIDMRTGPLSYFVGGDGAPFLHVHGAGGLRVSNALQDLTDTHRVFMPLVPGFDDTPAHDDLNSFPELADMLADFADKEIGTPCPVNGHAMGLGATIALLCDTIFMSSKAKIGDPHVKIGVVAGDGGCVIWPQLIGYAKAKEYLMLAKPYTGRELEKMGLINYAENDARTLDAKVDEMVQGLLAKGAYTLAWTKRLCNRHVVEQLNRVLDASIGYEMVGFLQREALGGEDPKSL